LCGEGIIASSRILYKEGHCWQGDIEIPDSIQTGIYILRTYTTFSGSGNNIVANLPIVILNRFGKNEQNEQKKTKNGYKPYTLCSSEIKKNEKLKVYAGNNRFKPGSSIEFWIENEGVKPSCGYSFVVKKQIEAVAHTNEQYNPETEQNKYLSKNTAASDGLSISGKIIQKDNGQPFKNGLVLVSVPDSIPQIFYSNTDKNGKFDISIDKLYGKQDVIVQTLEKDIPLEIELDQFHLPAPESIPYYVPAWIEQSQDAQLSIERATLQKAYPPKEVSLLQIRENQCPFYGKPYSTIKTTDYYELNDFVEISRELLSLCRIRGNNQNHNIKLIEPNLNVFLETPWLLVDGVPIFNLEDIIPLGSTIVKKVDTQTKIRCYGDLYIEGALSLSTFSGDFSDVPLPKNAIRTQMEMLYQPSQYPGNTVKEVTHEPDFRDVLCWIPSVDATNEAQTVNVQCSYETGNYIAVVKMIDESGASIEASFPFTISETF
jgi:hypothetical protein